MSANSRLAIDLIDEDLQQLRNAVGKDRQKNDKHSEDVHMAVYKRFHSLRKAIVFHESFNKVN